jgi:hypothetical protein
MNMSRIRGPYVRFCERDEVNLISSPHPTRLSALRSGQIRPAAVRRFYSEWIFSSERSGLPVCFYVYLWHNLRRK